MYDKPSLLKPGLNNRLDQAIKKFKESVSMWTRIDDDLVAFNKEYQGLQTFVNSMLN